MRSYHTPNMGSIPPVVKNLLIINVLMFLMTAAFESTGLVDLNEKLGLYFMKSPNFKPFQYVTYMFMHASLLSKGGIMHIFFNMFALYMFGRILENVWGPKRFFIYYVVTGLGAAIVHTIVNYVDYISLTNSLTEEQISLVISEGTNAWQQGKNFVDPQMRDLNTLFNVPTIGASGAVFGVLLAFGMLFPNTQLMLLFPPIPIKAKYFVVFYGIAELFLGVSNRAGDNVAHFAHLGGMIFGYFLILYWKKNTKHFY
jgi:membrane associated rhomboid family serine protease